MWIIFSKYAPRQLKMAMTKKKSVRKLCLMMNIEIFFCVVTLLLFFMIDGHFLFPVCDNTKKLIVIRTIIPFPEFSYLSNVQENCQSFEECWQKSGGMDRKKITSA